MLLVSGSSPVWEGWFSGESRSGWVNYNKARGRSGRLPRTSGLAFNVVAEIVSINAPKPDRVSLPRPILQPGRTAFLFLMISTHAAFLVVAGSDCTLKHRRFRRPISSKAFPPWTSSPVTLTFQKGTWGRCKLCSSGIDRLRPSGPCPVWSCPHPPKSWGARDPDWWSCKTGRRPELPRPLLDRFGRAVSWPREEPEPRKGPQTARHP